MHENETASNFAQYFHHPYWYLQNEVLKCLMCKDAPCATACPHRLKPDRRIRSLHFQNIYGACSGLTEDVCADCDAPCEKACVLTSIGTDAGVPVKTLMQAMSGVCRIEDFLPQDKPEPDLSLDICGVRIENPFLLSSSVVASNYEMIAKAFDLGWAGACYKTICSFDVHEASPRFSALRDTTLSFYGFKNIEQLSDHSVDENLEIFRKLKEKYPTKVIIASIMGKNREEWTSLAKRCQEAGADVIELNFSCPNMEDGGLGVTIGQSAELVEQFTAAARRGCTIPLLAKLTPNVEDMVPLAIAAKRGGADGIAAINTIKSITGVSVTSMAPKPSISGKSVVGGYSGAAVKPIALRFISDLANEPELAGMHISGMGGIENWHSAMEFLLLGAGSLQITTAVMQYGYRIIGDLISGLRGCMLEHNLQSLYQVVSGAARAVVPPEDIERDTILFPEFDPEICVGCGRCQISCYDGGHQAITFDKKTRRPSLNAAKCVGCHLCIIVCPARAISTVAKRIHREPKHKE